MAEYQRGIEDEEDQEAKLQRVRLNENKEDEEEEEETQEVFENVNEPDFNVSPAVKVDFSNEVTIIVYVRNLQDGEKRFTVTVGISIFSTMHNSYASKI